MSNPLRTHSRFRLRHAPWCVLLLGLLAVSPVAAIAQREPSTGPATVAGDAVSDAVADASNLDEHGIDARLLVVGTLAQGDPVVIERGARDFLEQNRPNPFGNVSLGTEISYALAAETRVELYVYDFFYRRIATLVDEVKPPGRHTVRFDPRASLSSGMYFYELKTERYRELRRMMYVK